MSFVTCHVLCFICHMSRVRCHMSHVACRLSPVIFHLSLPPTATATHPRPTNSPIMHSRLVCIDPKTQTKNSKRKSHQNGKNLKGCRGMPILAMSSSTRSLQSTGMQGFRDDTDTHTTDGHRNLESESAQWADSVKVP